DDPLVEVGGPGRRGGGGPLDAAEHAVAIRGIEPMDVVLERIGNEAALDPHPRLALVVQPRRPQCAIENRVVVPVVAELDVAAHVPGERVVVEEARGETAGGGALLEDEVVVVPELLEPDGGAEPRRPCADDQDAARVPHDPTASRGTPRHATRIVCSSER